MSDSDNDAAKDTNVSDEDDDVKGSTSKGSGKSRRELPSGAVATLKAWLLSPEHFTHPYPTPQDQIMLMQKTGIDKKQLKNWFTNARRRIWKPMLKKQLEQGKLAATGTAGGVAVPTVGMPGIMAPVVQVVSGQPGDGTPGGEPGTQTVQLMHVHYQHAIQQPQQQQQQQQQGQIAQYDMYGNAVYVQQPQQAQQQQQQQQQQNNIVPTQFYSQQQFGQQPQQAQPGPAPISSSPTQAKATAPTDTSKPQTMNKTDSHAILMELFTRDQDLVRQATESAKLKQQQQGNPQGGGDNGTSQAQPLQVTSQHPMAGQHSNKFGNVPALNSWPHFSSVSSLNNLGNMTGVKSITSLSSADLASQGNLNKKGNLAQVKSMESMGRNDSYAFLELFFDDKGMNTQQRGVKREREEDNDVGLYLDGDEGTTSAKPNEIPSNGNVSSGAPRPAPLPADGIDRPGMNNDAGTLKRAYEDAVAARGLLSVSRSSEKLSDLALPPKMQKTLSQEYVRQSTQTFGGFGYMGQAAVGGDQTGNQQGLDTFQNSPKPTSQQYPGQHPGQQQQQQQQQHQQPQQNQNQQTAQLQTNICQVADPTAPKKSCENQQMQGSSVEVPAQTKCALCQATNVDTQLRPCGHMFHKRCLKPSLQTPTGQPKCPIDHIPIQSALVAVPTDEETSRQQSESQQQAPAQQQIQQQQTWGKSNPAYTVAISGDVSKV